MVEFATEPYYTPMDRQYGGTEVKHKKIEEPIFTLDRIGQTVVETGKYPNLVQDLNAAIRGGQGVIEMQTMERQTFESVGKEAREAIRDLAHANEVKLTSVHCPNAVQNLSGFNAENGTITEQFAEMQLDDVRKAIKFASDVLNGGAVVVHPQQGEFQRDMTRADWNQEGKWKGAFEGYAGEKEAQVVRLVDDRTGKIESLSLREGIWIKRKPGSDERTEKLQEWKMEDFEEDARLKGVKTMDVFKEEILRPQIASTKSTKAFHERALWGAQKGLKELGEEIGSGIPTPEQKRLEDHYKDQIESEQMGLDKQEETLEKIEESKKHLKPMEEFALDKSTDGYANAAIMAMDEEQNMPKSDRGELFIAIENSWPGGFGTHPEELMELVEKSREKMAEKLYDERGFTMGQAKQEAARHIKATFDTAHMGMWLKHFKKKNPQETENQRVARFKEWFLDETKKMAEKGILGNVHLVDTQGTSHQHLPIGQGILPIKQAMKILKKNNYSGYLISEAFEEEKYGAGRISIETYKELGADAPSAYMQGPRRKFADVHGGYAGRTPSPRQMIGSYAPPYGEYKMWSEIPLE